jgi:hypothetical protein
MPALTAHYGLLTDAVATGATTHSSNSFFTDPTALLQLVAATDIAAPSAGQKRKARRILLGVWYESRSLFSFERVKNFMSRPTQTNRWKKSEEIQFGSFSATDVTAALLR